jgi:RecA/RadA recombinase
MVKNKAIKVDLNKAIEKARSNFVKSEKGLGLQMVRGNNIPRPTKDHEFVHWKGSAWEVLTGIMGAPFGRIIQVSGKPDSGKTTHAMEFAKLGQMQDVVVIYWDIENKFSAKRFDKFVGGKSEDLLMVTSKLILEGSDMIDAYVHAIMEQNPNQKILIIWDSVGGSMAVGEAAKSKRESNQTAEQAKDNAKVMRGFVQLMERYKNRKTNEERIAVLLINQTYSSVRGPARQIESGGSKVEFFSSLIVQLKRTGTLFKTRDKIKRKLGIAVKATVKKNHLFDGEDTLAEMKLHIKAGGVFIDPTDPAAALLKGSEQVQNDPVEIAAGDDEGEEE